jgi:exosortase/archaeosortase family protein
MTSRDNKAESKPGQPRSSLALGLRFAVLLGGIYFLFTFGPLYDRIVKPFTQFTAWLAAAFGQMINLSVRVSGITLLGPSSSVNVGQGCDAIDVISIIIAAGIATPAAMTRKLSFFAIGFVVILSLNIARLLTLLYAASVSYTLMDILHVYVWPVVLLFACLGLWYYWFEARRTA